MIKIKRKYQNFSREEIVNIINSSTTAKEALLKMGYYGDFKISQILQQIVEEHQIDVKHLLFKLKDKWKYYTDEEIINILKTSQTYDEALQRLGYCKKNSGKNYLIDELSKKYNINFYSVQQGLPIGLKINHWTIIGVSKRTDSSNNKYYICQCDCKNQTIKEVPASRLINKSAISCGCEKRSKGEVKIATILKNLNIPFEEQYNFENLLSYKGYKLYFDFYLKNKNACIEFQGQQHYQEMGYLGGQSKLERQQKNDNIKRKYCKENNIKLIEIPYYDYKKLDESYILNLLGDNNNE